MVAGAIALPSGTINSISLATRPFIWVRDTERAAILDKIATNAWATSMFNSLVSREAASLVLLAPTVFAGFSGQLNPHNSMSSQ